MLSGHPDYEPLSVMVSVDPKWLIPGTHHRFPHTNNSATQAKLELSL